MSKAAELAALIGSQSALSNRNLVINGAMQVAQRGTSTASVTGNGYHACDRWHLELSGLGTFTISQSTDAPTGFSNSFKVDCTTADASPAASDYMVVQQKIEAQTLRQLGYGASGAKAMTLSFYVKSNKTGTYEIMHFASDGARAVNSTYTINSANTWEFKSVSIPGDTGGTMNNDNGEGLRSLFYLGVGSQRQSGTTPTDWQAYAIANEAPSQTVNIADNTANEWLITGVQLEVGEQATPFEHRSFGDELFRCQRYYQAHGNGVSGLSFSINDMPASIATDTVNITGKFFVKMMRAAPTMVIYSRNSTANKVSLVATGADYATSTFAPNVIGVTGFHVVSRSGGSNLTKGDGLEYGYTADAEL